MPTWRFSNFVWDQYTKMPPVLTADLTKKTVLVTGANAGIGIEAAKHFARMGPARLIIACRSEAKGKAATEQIAKETSYNAELELVDLDNFASVVALAKRLHGQPIDILVANAAVARTEYIATKDGWEQMIQVNHLSTALLSMLLVPNLVKASELHASCSRLVVVASEVHHLVPLDDVILETNILATLGSQEYCTEATMKLRYSLTKLLNLLFVRAFASHLAPAYAPYLIPSAANPGSCVSDLMRNAPAAFRARMRILQAIFSRTAEQGARQLVYASLGPDGEDGPHVEQTMSGAFITLSQSRQPSDFVTSKAGWKAQEKIWRETIDILSDVEPSVRTIAGQYFKE